MTEDLEGLVQAVEGQGPSADFVARLRAQIVAETQATFVSNLVESDPSADPVFEAIADDTVDDEITVVVDLATAPPARRPSRRLQLIGAAAAVAALFLVGVWAFIDDNDDDVSELDMVVTPDVLESEDDRLVEGAPITAGNTFFQEGTYRIDTLGTPFTFSVEDTLGMLVNENGVVLITELTSRSTDDRTLTLRRTALLPDPAVPTMATDVRTGWPAADLAGWLDRLAGGVATSDPTDTTLGGLAATTVEIEFPCLEEGCSPADPPIGPNFTMFTAGFRYRLWIVDQGSEDPIVVTAAVDADGEAVWLDEAAAILSTVDFESIEPNPVRRPAAGFVELDVFDGVSLTLPADVVVVEPFDGFARFIPTGLVGDVELLTRPLDVEGVEVTSTDQLVGLLEDKAVSVNEVGSVSVGGIDARSFEVDSGDIPNVVLKAREADLVRAEFGWESPRDGHLWLVEHPERGLLVVSAESPTGQAAVEPLRSWTDGLLQSLEFERN